MWFDSFLDGYHQVARGLDVAGRSAGRRAIVAIASAVLWLVGAALLVWLVLG